MDGRILAQKVRSKVKEQVEVLKPSNIEPFLATILVGDNPASKTYLKNKHAACLEVGIRSHNIELSSTTTQLELEHSIKSLNEDAKVTGILLQLPLPRGLDEVTAISAIGPGKDVDGLTPYNMGLLVQKTAKLVACTPSGVMALLRYYGVRIAGSHAVIINRSKLVGRPLSQLLLNEDATVTVCHSKTRDLKEICRTADILITGIGHRSEFTVSSDMMRPGAAIVDVGTSVVNGKLMGDVDFEAATKLASYVTPVPGGVGPMTIAMLLYNTMVAASLQKGTESRFNVNELA
jgi:methylenetetrahydrofolate dehydrogenase (NADP+)/methenyltetrahydrofolate cyclohydrolase